MKHTSVFSEAEEERLWCTGVLGTGSPKALLNAVFVVVGKVFCLRGGREHEMLKFVTVSVWKRRFEGICRVH